MHTFYDFSFFRLDISEKECYYIRKQGQPDQENIKKGYRFSDGVENNTTERLTKMEEKKEVFADGIGQIHFAGGMVRYDFVTLQPEKEGAAPVPKANLRIIMPPQGFLATFNSMQQLIDKLLDAGILQKNENAKK